MKKRNPLFAALKDAAIALVLGFIVVQMLAGCVALFPNSQHRAADFRATAEIVAAVLVLEARGDGPIGEIAVANVIVNRSKNSPDGLLLQVFKPNQFNVVTGKNEQELIAAAKHVITGEEWDIAVSIATDALLGNLEDITDGATHFHSGPAPSWAAGMTLTAQIGHHYFYSERKPNKASPDKVGESTSELPSYTSAPARRGGGGTL